VGRDNNAWLCQCKAGWREVSAPPLLRAYVLQSPKLVILAVELPLYDLSTILGNKIVYSPTVDISPAAYDQFLPRNRVEYVNMLGRKNYFEKFCSFAHLNEETRQI
jgi:hypothetical protein